MKIVIIPGVGYQSNGEDHNYLGREIVKKLGYGGYEIFKWNYQTCPTLNLSLEDMRKKCEEYCELSNMSGNLAYQAFRRYLVEVILDFEYALKYGQSIQVTPADYYVGHSAGSLFAIAQNKPSTLLGSPYALAKCIPKQFMTSDLFMKSMENTNAEILNLINEYDVLSFPIYEQRVNNVYFSGHKLNPLTYFPLTAHFSYWKSSFVIQKIVSHIKKSIPIV